MCTGEIAKFGKSSKKTLKKTKITFTRFRMDGHRSFFTLILSVIIFQEFVNSPNYNCHYSETKNDAKFFNRKWIVRSHRQVCKKV